ncbi:MULTISPECIES: DinB family protein [Paenibacillus]|uniref:Formate dehydrogenase n=1 Tax=Paenibacillus albilobatus TaxID=2716884 RepID=A0A919XQ34_9BACL|nr:MULTISPECIES: DinB family protein [Paenibacillus]GIO34672.1 formate dehydrogenase [Paenibacillus albilobatus]
MRDAYLFGLMLKNRNTVISKVENLPADKRIVVPQGFNNNIHWQLGHLLTVTSAILFRFSGRDSVVPDDYQAFFGNGTKPADWNGEPPAWDTLIQGLTEQCKLIEDTFTGKLGEPLAIKDNFAKAETVGEAFAVNLGHENYHLGMINAMLRVLG